VQLQVGLPLYSRCGRADQGWCWLVDLPKDFVGGNGTVRIYVDDGADASQMQELEAIFTGRKGGPGEVLKSLVTKWLPTQKAKIAIQGGDNPSVTVGTVGQVTAKRISDDKGRVAKLVNAPVLGAIQVETLDLARGDGTRFADPDMRPWESGGHQPGEQAIFLRLDSYTGIWVRDDLCFYPDLQGAIDRAASQQVRIPAPGQVRIRVRGVWTEQAIATTQPNSPGQFSDRPATDVSFFLSFASANVLIARQIFEDLKHDARVEVWFDLDQSGESLAHEGHIGRWLRTAIYSRRGFLLLWTGQAAQSEWVRKEILWAREKAEKDSDFRFIVLKLDDTPIPESLVDTEDVIDCSGLWPVHGVVEELFAAVTGRHGRRIWVRGHQQRGIAIKPDEGSSGYDPLQSDSGAAISLRHWDESGRLCWELEYEKNGKSETASGQGPLRHPPWRLRRFIRLPSSSFGPVLARDSRLDAL
jgi:hypothetical protein